MYTTLLTLHSVARWAVLLFGVLAVVRALHGMMRNRDWTREDNRAGLFFMIAFDVQLLLGLGLYFGLSPITSAALEDMKAAMSIPALRFWAVEHVTLMLVALILAHAGRVSIRRAPSAAARHRRALIFFGLALVAALGGIPWPGTTNGRPLFRLGA